MDIIEEAKAQLHTYEKVSKVVANNLITEIESLRAQLAERQWISVDERLPEQLQEVLIYAKGVVESYPHIIVVAQYYEGFKPQWYQYDLEVDEYCQPTIGVTHWMHLPQPPKAISEKC